MKRAYLVRWLDPNPDPPHALEVCSDTTCWTPNHVRRVDRADGTAEWHGFIESATPPGEVRAKFIQGSPWSNTVEPTESVVFDAPEAEYFDLFLAGLIVLLIVAKWRPRRTTS